MNLRFGAIAANHNNFSVSVSGYYDVFYMGSDKTLAFWENYLTTPTMLHYYFSIATGSLIEKLRVHFTQFIKIERKIPCLQEQQKIADFLSLIDKRIELQRQLVENLKKYKRGSIFKIFSLENNLNSYIPMSELLTEINDRNTQGLQVCSVAVNKGVINQIEHLGRSFSARDTSNYRCVHYGDIVYTKSPTGDFPYGIVKQSKINENVAVSPLYGVYKPVDYATGNLIHYYFEQAENANNYIRSLAQKGAKNTINIATSHFLEKNILFPRDTVKRVFYSEYLDKINGLILSNEKYLYKLQEIKRGLLQQMFI